MAGIRRGIEVAREDFANSAFSEALSDLKDCFDSCSYKKRRHDIAFESLIISV